MKDRPPIKRHQAMASFSRDHHSGLLLVWKIRQGLLNSIDPERIGDYVLFFYKEDLEKHFRDEEKLLFCKLSPDDSLRKQAETDHQLVYAMMADLENKKDYKDLLHSIADRLEKHIRFEERELFNHLQDILSSEELETIAKRFPIDSKAPDEAWKDKFWMK
ncbi:MAG TPA: hemerythrin domain-containing protein [Puia sp.]|nr:hemerythrin domain-containing protein [Puia sp.]